MKDNLFEAPVKANKNALSMPASKTILKSIIAAAEDNMLTVRKAKNSDLRDGDLFSFHCTFRGEAIYKFVAFAHTLNEALVVLTQLHRHDSTRGTIHYIDIDENIVPNSSTASERLKFEHKAESLTQLEAADILEQLVPLTEEEQKAIDSTPYSELIAV